MADNETISDIIAEMRQGTRLPGYWRSCSVNKILQYHADRLEAAHKRERGNAAKLREALSKSCAYFAVVLNTGTFNRIHLEALLNMAKAALAAPARNCEVYTADELKAIFKSELVSQLPIANEHEKNLVTITATGVIDTLFATTQKGGNDAD